jgi:peroxiredoxin
VIETPSCFETIIEPSPADVVGPPETVVPPESETDIDPVVTETPPVQPWDQWSDLPPLRGDFQAMIHQVVGDIDWLLVAQGEKFSPDIAAMLAEGKANLETSCKVCDEDPDLFAGTEAVGETVRDVTGQLKQFSDLLAQSLEQPQMKELGELIAPARADRSKVPSIMGSVSAERKNELLGMFALETLKKRGDQLVEHAVAVENGTFRPVGVEALQQELKVGEVAPDFSIQTVDGETVSLSDYNGKKVVLLFNRGHFCPYCMDQVNQMIDAASQINAEVLVIFRETPPGGDAKAGIEGLRAYKSQANPPFVLGIDFGSQATAAYSQQGHFSTYVIDSEGKIAAELRGVKYIRPSAQAVAKAVDAAN